MTEEAEAPGLLITSWAKCGECGTDVLAKVHPDGTVEPIVDCVSHD